MGVKTMGVGIGGFLYICSIAIGCIQVSVQVCSKGFEPTLLREPCLYPFYLPSRLPRITGWGKLRVRLPLTKLEIGNGSQERCAILLAARIC